MEESRNLDSYLSDYYGLPFERYAEKYRKRAILEVIDRLNPNYLVEVGCGQDSIFHYLNKSIVGTIVEPIRELIINQDVESRLPNIKIVNEYFENIKNVESNQADVVLLSSIVHEVSEPEILLETAKKFLKYNGVAIIVVPNAWSIHRFIGERKKLISHLEKRSTTQIRMQQMQPVFNPQTLSLFIESCGFEIDELKTFFPKISSHAQMQFAINQKIINEEYVEMMYNMSAITEPTGSEIIAVARHRNG